MWKLFVRRKILCRSGLMAVLVLTLPCLVHPFDPVLSTILRIFARGTMYGQKRASFTNKVHSYRPLIVISPLGLAKYTRYSWVVGGGGALHINHWLEGVQQNLPMPVPEASVDPDHVVGYRRISRRWVGRSERPARIFHKFWSLLSMRRTPATFPIVGVVTLSARTYPVPLRLSRITEMILRFTPGSTRKSCQ